MVDEKVIARIRENLKRGVPIETIRVDLIASGFSNEEINEAINLARQSIQPSFGQQGSFNLPQHRLPTQNSSPMQQPSFQPLLAVTQQTSKPKNSKLKVFFIVTLFAVLGIVFGLTAYFMFEGEKTSNFLIGARNLTANEIKSQVLTKMKNDLHSYAFDMTLSMLVNRVGNETSYPSEVKMDASGESDLSNKKMHIDLSFDTISSGFRIGLESDSYIINEIMYSKIFNTWTKKANIEDMWENQDNAKKNIELIENATIESLGEETIDGKQHYVTKMVLSKQKLNEFFLKSQDKESEWEEEYNMNIENFSYKTWVDKETFFIKKTQVIMKMILIPKEIKYTDELRNDVDFSYEIVFSRFNEQLNITLPPAALNATEVNEDFEYGNETNSSYYFSPPLSYGIRQMSK